MKTLTDIFYELVNDGYIYDTNDEGRNMSYGEYAAISDYMQEEINEQIQGLNYPEAVELWRELVTYSDDDAKTFAGMTESELDLWMIYEDYDEESNDLVFKCTNPEDLPQILQDSYFDWLEYHPEIAA